MVEADTVERLAQRAQTILSAASVGASTGDAYKWVVGDMIAQMQDVVTCARQNALHPRQTVCAEIRLSARACAESFEKFILSQPATRNTLIDYAAIARQFPASHPVRTSLSFSKVRAIARVKSKAAQEAWIARAVAENLSVARLQMEINAAASSSAVAPSVAIAQPSAATAQPSGPDGPVARRGARRLSDKPPQAAALPRSQHLLRCAYTGRPITDTEASVKITLRLNAAQEALLPPRRGAAAKGRSMEEQAKLPRQFVFENCAALQAWLAAFAENAIVVAPVRKMARAKPAEEGRS